MTTDPDYDDPADPTDLDSAGKLTALLAAAIEALALLDALAETLRIPGGPVPERLRAAIADAKSA